ncbi:MAG: hypothetical protein C3F06_05895 [Candidatus Methanoperedenaceae archaeon]|nr:MAG: hypothetical protein C3F06_05895 [Candidatus Methanoperedenaceae archaeon]
MKQNIKVWFNIMKTAVSLNGYRQYIFYISNLDIYRFIEYSNTLRILDNIKSRKKILDLGTGYSISPQLYSKYSNVKALDINKKACIWQKKNGNESLIADLCNMPIISNSIDVIIAISSIEHVPDDRKVYSEINRILKKGGVLIISVPYSSNESYVVKGLRKGFAVKLLNSKYLQNFWKILLSGDNFFYFKEQTQTDFLEKRYSKNELLSIIKDENWKIEEEIIFGRMPFRYFFKIFPPGWFILKDLIFGYIFHMTESIFESNDGNTIFFKLTKSEERD